MFMPKIISFTLIPAALALTGCASMPTITNSNVPPEFAEQIRNADRYPDVADAPSAPTNIPRATVWDDKARAMMRAKGSFEALDAPLSNVSALIMQQLQILSQRVNEHKLDDPK